MSSISAADTPKISNAPVQLRQQQQQQQQHHHHHHRSPHQHTTTAVIVATSISDSATASAAAAAATITTTTTSSTSAGAVAVAVTANPASGNRCYNPSSTNVCSVASSISAAVHHYQGCHKAAAVMASATAIASRPSSASSSSSTPPNNINIKRHADVSACSSSSSYCSSSSSSGAAVVVGATVAPVSAKTAVITQKMSRTIPSDKINLRLILVSGKTKEFLFNPSDSAGDIAQTVFDNWPEDWEREVVSKAEILRLIYQGRFLHCNVTLGALGLPLGKTTVMHLVPRDNLPEPNSQDQRQKSKGGSSRCCSTTCCIL